MILNLGCGSQVVDGWVNVDYALGARLAKLPLFRVVNSKLRLFRLNWDPRIYIHDLTKPFPWPDGSAEAIYSSHTLEHLTKDEGYRFLSECHRVLREHGIIRIVVPDLRHIVRKYLDGHIVADDFVESLGVLYARSGGRVRRTLATFLQFPHKCMYDNERLLKILDETGFVASRRASFDSDIPNIHLVELESRTRNAVVVEGRKKAVRPFRQLSINCS